jgi:hypothetical protein
MLAEVSSEPDWIALAAGAFAVVLPVFAAYVWRRLSHVRIGEIEIYRSVDEEAEKVRERLAPGHDEGYEEREYRLLSEYHAQGLAQSRTSFRFSIFFASLGFAVILATVVFAIGSHEPTAGTTVSLISGAIVEAIAGLFFVQSNRARELMVAFFDRLRTDRKLRNALALAESIDDVELRGRLQSPTGPLDGWIE